jgi:cell division septum initiation protein DivIVA
MSKSQPDATDPLVDALRRKVKTLEDRLDDLEAENTELRSIVETLQDRAPDPSRMDYDAMDKADKATVVRSKLKAEAESTTGKAAASYKDVIRMFDGHPSAGHAYDLMDAAAERDGMSINTSPEGQKRLTYNTARVNDSA